MNHEIESRVTSFLGLCLRAGRLTTGQEACVELIRRAETPEDYFATMVF